MANTHRLTSKLYIFGTVVKAGSFSRAAQWLDLGKAAVSQHISELERDIGVRLLNRSTRALALTAEGQSLLPHASALIEATDRGLDVVSKARSELSGQLKLTAARDIGAELLPPLIARFNARHPDVQIELTLDNDIVDLESEQFDIALQMGVKRRQGWVVRKLTQSAHGVYASQRTAERLQRLITPKQLEHMPAAIFTGFQHSDRWSFTRSGEVEKIKLLVQARANSIHAIKHWIQHRPLIAVLPNLMVDREIQLGTLRNLLPDWELPRVTVALAHRRISDLPDRVSAFIDFALHDIAEQKQPLSR